MTRFSPYFWGIYASQLYLDQVKSFKDDQTKELSYISHPGVYIFEIFSFVATIAISYEAKSLEPEEVISKKHCYFRIVLGITISFLVHVMLNPATPQISMLRPARFLRWFLSLNIWVPIAVLSYSIYLFHIYPVMGVNMAHFMNPLFDPDNQEKTIFGKQMIDDNGDWTVKKCPWEKGSNQILYKFLGAFAIVLAASSFISMLVYVCLEKPGIDAKRIYKNKNQPWKVYV